MSEKSLYDDVNAGDDVDLSIDDDFNDKKQRTDVVKRRELKRRLDDLLEQKQLRKSLGMDEEHSYWDDLELE